MEEYRDVAFLREESTEQVYIVNRRLLKARTRNRNNQRASSSLAGEEILWLQTDWGKPILVRLLSLLSFMVRLYGGRLRHL